ncbi:RNA-binding protein 12B-like [Dendropsophus ebraccatus]|uniref:RNA-binding protein 12B-like n=1 Tax=Dendropsophus ebraccatus TaxID=150705 RepID=UPI003832157B
MSLTVRLQGLPPNADSGHIRKFFRGLKIAPSGVNIIGGVHGEAFVSFKKITCVKYALQRSGEPLMDVPVYVSLSQLQKPNRQTTEPVSSPGYRQTTEPVSSPGYRQTTEPVPNSSDRQTTEPVPNSGYRQTTEPVPNSGYKQMTEPVPNSGYRQTTKPAFLRISYSPLSANLSHVKEFFKGMSVKSVIFQTTNKVRNGQALVKFENLNDVRSILAMYRLSKNSSKWYKKPNAFSVYYVKPSRLGEWISWGGKTKQVCQSLPEMSGNDGNTAYAREFYAHLVNMSPRAEKSHIKKFFHNLVGDSQISFHFKNGSRTTECFVMFITENDYVRALELDKVLFMGYRVRVLPITKARMLDLIHSTTAHGELISEEELEPEVKYFYLRNFAAGVSKLDVIDFFNGFSLTEKDIYLLYDDNGGSLGEALVRLSREEASRAEELNHKKFQDTEILLRCISEKQLKVFGVDCFQDRSTAKEDTSTDMESCGAEASVTQEDDGVY